MGRNSECVKVVVRCRPLSQNEVKDGRKRTLEMDQAAGQVIIRNPKAPPDQPPMMFTFDQVYDWTSTQRDVYDISAAPIIDAVLQGYNGTIFAYGQTGSGKTHTMQGVPEDPDLRGVIPTAFNHVFSSIARNQEKTHMVRASMLEIYNEEIRDLLGRDQSKKLDMRESVEKGVYIDGLTSFTVSCVAELMTVLNVGSKNRTVGATKMNQDSSRSHSIFTLTVEQADKEAGEDGGHVRVGKLNLVDLAGSERQSKTGATGQRLKEATKINLSLSALGNVISALVDGKSTHVPYRDSKLTRMLQDSLGGNTKTVMVANCGPADYNYDETMSTLRYANRAKNIQNKPKINEDPKDAMIREYQEKVAELKAKLAQRKGAAQPPQIVKKVVEVEAGAEKIAAVREQMMAELAQRMEQERDQEALKAAKKQAEEKARKALEEMMKDAQKSEEEKKAIQSALAQQHAELEEYAAKLEAERRAQEALEKELNDVQSKVLDGGENLFEKIEGLEEVEREHERELEVQRRQAQEQERRLRDLKEEAMLETDQFHDVREEIETVRARLAEVEGQQVQRKAEMEEVLHAQQLEREDLMAQVRELEQITRLKDLVISWFIPPEWLAVIKERCYEDPTTEDWIVDDGHLCGNRVRNNEIEDSEGTDPNTTDDLSSVYLSYRQLKEADDGGGKTRKRSSANKAARAAAAAARPGAARPKAASGASKTTLSVGPASGRGSRRTSTSGIGGPLAPESSQMGVGGRSSREAGGSAGREAAPRARGLVKR
ncbi:unnamed protein product [Pedinophyceae sp. YPF-701]|nr:unnamed protein product [Pedinophyceae sp. YPF-701]